MDNPVRLLACAWFFLIAAPAGADERVEEGYVSMPDGVRLFYRVAGEGESVVLLPGAVTLFQDFRRLASGRKLIAYDQRNRGRSDAVTERAKVERGVLQEADDMEVMRRHFQVDRIAVIGHSYVGVVAALYAMNHPGRVSRVVQIGPPAPVYGKRYPPDAGPDATVTAIFAKIGELQRNGAGMDPEELCERVWEVLRPMYVVDAKDANRLAHWGACDLPNERNAMHHFGANITPSMKTLTLTSEQFARASMPVLTIHGTKDRNAPYGGGREWASLLPNARLLTIENAAHAPWVEAPEKVFDAIDLFLKGEWPEGAEGVRGEPR